jgi:two-component system, cell cycle response regulator DivK
MDIQLPGISGVEALHRLRADPVTSRTPVIAITASVMTQDRTRIMAAGFNGFHGKPISVRQLLATVREILTSHEPGRCQERPTSGRPLSTAWSANLSLPGGCVREQ